MSEERPKPPVDQLSRYKISVSLLLQLTGFSSVGELIAASLDPKATHEKYPEENIPDEIGEKPFARISFTTQNGPQFAEVTILSDNWVKIEIYDSPININAFSLNHLYAPRFVRLDPSLRPTHIHTPNPRVRLVEKGFNENGSGVILRATSPDGHVSESHIGSKTPFMDNQIRLWLGSLSTTILTTVDYTKLLEGKSHKLPNR